MKVETPIMAAADRPVGFVAGLGRCGSTLVMSMLDAGGIPVAGSAPAYEDIPASPSGTDYAWVKAQTGRVVKWIDPVHTKMPYDLHGPAVWLTRDVKEQARSQLKFTRALIQNIPINRETVRIYARMNDAENRRAVWIVKHRDPHALHLRFEEIILHPMSAARKLAEKFAPLGDLDVEAAAAKVIQRDPACLDGFLEARL